MGRIGRRIWRSLGVAIPGVVVAVAVLSPSAPVSVALVVAHQSLVGASERVT